jgi:hypothetical protein
MYGVNSKVLGKVSKVACNDGLVLGKVVTSAGKVLCKVDEGLDKEG